MEMLMIMVKSQAPLVLGSGSTTRARILTDAGVPFVVKPPIVDENKAFNRLTAMEASIQVAALELAELKARDVSASLPNRVVLSADQILECRGTWFQKASSLVQARENLESLSGHKHRLVSAVTAAEGGEIIWRFVDQAVLSVRPLSPSFLDSYFEAVGDRALDSVGGYQIESRGAQLFSWVEGDYTTILGLPLIPVLRFLRKRGILEC